MRFLLCAAMTATLLAAGPVAGEEKMYKWVDEDGNVTYQDRPPPGESRQSQSFEQSPDQSADAAPGNVFPDVDVTLYAIDTCDPCDLVRKLLNDRGLPFTEKDANGSLEVQEELEEVAGVLSVPALVIGDEVLTGYNKALIVRVLEDAGFRTSPGSPAQVPSAGQSPDSGQLTREEMEQAARDAAPDNDLFDEDTFSDSGARPAGDDISQWEEIPEDERIRVGQ